MLGACLQAVKHTAVVEAGPGLSGGRFLRVFSE